MSTQNWKNFLLNPRFLWITIHRSAAKPQLKFGVSPAKPQRREGFKKKIISELGVFAPWREKIRN
jgi:hypothetical protein